MNSLSDQQVKDIFDKLLCSYCGTANFQPNERCFRHPTKELRMSFSVTFIGKPEALKKKLDEESDRLTDQSKIEFDAVKPALKIILDQHVGDHAVSLNAFGHAAFTNGVKTQGNCQVEIKSLGRVVE